MKLFEFFYIRFFDKSFGLEEKVFLILNGRYDYGIYSCTVSRTGIREQLVSEESRCLPCSSGFANSLKDFPDFRFAGVSKSDKAEAIVKLFYPFFVVV